MEYSDKEMLVMDMVQGVYYTLKGEMGDPPYEKIKFKKDQDRIYVLAYEDDDQKPFEWNFDMKLVTILGDPVIEIDELEYDQKKYFGNIKINALTLDDLKIIEQQLGIFISRYSEMPHFIKLFVEMPEDWRNE